MSLTEEEKAIKLKELKEKLNEKQMLRKIQEEKEAHENELIRRKRDRELVQLVEETKRQIQLRDIQLRKDEKKQDLLEKKRIKERIEADKRERKERAEKTYNMKNDLFKDHSTFTPSKTNSYNISRLQIRVEAGNKCPPIIRSFSSEDTLRFVAECIFSESGVSPDVAVFISTFPKREYSGNDLDKNLRELQLVPSSVLILRC